MSDVQKKTVTFVKHTVNVPGGMFKQKSGEWVDGLGKPIDPENQTAALDAQIAYLQAQRDQLASKGNIEVDGEDDPEPATIAEVMEQVTEQRKAGRPPKTA